MTTTRAPARAAFDSRTGSLLAVSDARTRWYRPRLAPVDVSPGHEVRALAAGGGAAAVAGEGLLTWLGTDRRTTVSSPDLVRLAVTGQVAAGTSSAGALTVWSDLGGRARALSTALDFEPENVAVDPGSSAVVTWGWASDGSGVLRAFRIADDEMALLPARLPADVDLVDVAFPAGKGEMVVATTAGILVTSLRGNVVTRSDLYGLERVATVENAVAWVRSPDPSSLPIVGGATLTDGTLELGGELPTPRGISPLFVLAVAPSGPRILDAEGPEVLTELVPTASGWAEIARYDVGDR